MSDPTSSKSLFHLIPRRLRLPGVWSDRAIVVALTCLVLLPFLGSFGLWDPWETHYGEVGRQIIERNDWISTWWGSHWQDAGGSQEGSYFFSKPILLMWLMAMGLTVFGFSAFAIRIGVALVAVLGVVLVFEAGKQVWSRRAGFLMSAVLTTSPFWFFLSRQAQTDMPFVGLMTAGLAFFMLGVFGRDRDESADLFHYGLTFGWIGVVTVPQLTLILAGLSRWRGGPNPAMRAIAEPPMQGVIIGGVLLGLAALLGGVALWLGHRDATELGRKRRFRFAIGALAAMWLPLLGILVAALATSSSMPRDLLGWFSWGPTQASIYASLLGLSIYLSVARPIVERRRLYLLAFYVFIGLATLAKGLLGFMLPGAVLFFYILLTREWRLLKDVELLRGIPVFIAVTFPWYAAMLIRHSPGFWNRFFIHDHFKRLASGVHQLDTGSFEHFAKWLGYGLYPWSAFIPAALARFFSGKGLSEGDDRSRATLFLLLWAVIAFTLFTLSSTKFHHYIFPAVPPLAMLVALALDDLFERDLPSPWPLYLLAIPVIGFLTWDIVAEPQVLKNLFTYKYDREWDDAGWDVLFRWATIGLSVPMIVGAALALTRNRLLKRVGIGALVASATAFTFFCLDVYMPKVSETWSQKGVWDHYYANCTSTDGPPGVRVDKRYCDEPAIAYKLNWRGENFYSQNEMVPIRDDDDFTHFLNGVGDGPFYGIMEYARYRGEFQRKLPARFKGKACIVYDANVKFLLAKVPCAPDDPERKERDEVAGVKTATAR